MTDAACRAFTEDDYGAAREIVAEAFAGHVRDNPQALE